MLSRNFESMGEKDSFGMGPPLGHAPLYTVRGLMLRTVQCCRLNSSARAY